MLFKGRSINQRLGVVVDVDHERFVGLGLILPETDQSALLILSDVVAKVNESRDLFAGSAARIDDHTAPQISLREREEIKPCDNAEVVPATLECFEQVAIGVFVGIDDTTVAKNDL